MVRKNREKGRLVEGGAKRLDIAVAHVIDEDDDQVGWACFRVDRFSPEKRERGDLLLGRRSKSRSPMTTRI